jgi:putative ABC transport system substrate-binding protein
MQFAQLKRREFITLLGGAAMAWPRGAWGQQVGGIPTIGILWPGASPPASPRMEAFRQGLQDAGLAEGQDVQMSCGTLNGVFNGYPNSPPNWCA